MNTPELPPSGSEPAVPAAPEPTPEELSRRRFLCRVCMGLGAVGAAAVAVPAAGFLAAPLFEKEAGKWRTVGLRDDFEVGKTALVSYMDGSPLPWAGVTAKSAAWLRRESEDEFIAFSVNCTHLGCPVRWESGAELFLCPCHGGVYYKDGVVAAGPPPRPLGRYPVRVEQGAVQIKTSPIPIA